MADQFILIIEDDPTWQAIFSEIAADLGFKPTVAATYPEALTALTAQAYALAVVDMSLSELYYNNRDGLKMLRKIAALSQALPTIVVTGYATVELAIETLVELNAVNFFRKEDFDRRKFADTIQKQAIIKPQIICQHGRVPATFLQKVEAEVIKKLSERELEVLYLLSQGQTNKQIAAELMVSVNTVKKHTQSIFTKFNVNSRAAAVALVLGQGMIRDI